MQRWEGGDATGKKWTRKKRGSVRRVEQNTGPAKVGIWRIRVFGKARGHLQGLPTSNPRVGGPRAAKHNVMFLVKEISRVSGVECHGLEAIMLSQR